MCLRSDHRKDAQRDYLWRRGVFIYHLPIHIGQSLHPGVLSLSYFGDTSAWVPRGSVGIHYHGPTAEPGTSGFTCTELVAVAMAKVEGEEWNGAKVVSKTKRKRRRKRTYRKETEIQEALVLRVMPTQVKSRGATSRGSVQQAVPTDPQAIPEAVWWHMGNQSWSPNVSPG